jgi:hypothetical protein
MISIIIIVVKIACLSKSLFAKCYVNTFLCNFLLILFLSCVLLIIHLIRLKLFADDRPTTYEGSVQILCSWILSIVLFLIKNYPVYFSKHIVSRLDSLWRFLDKDRTMDNPPKHYICANVPSSQTFRSYYGDSNYAVLSFAFCQISPRCTYSQWTSYPCSMVAGFERHPSMCVVFYSSDGACD